MQSMKTFTFAEAAEATGLTKKALRNRVYRGQIQAVLHDGVRRIPRSELEREGLLISGAETGERHEVAPEIAHELSQETGLMSDLLERLERQAGELAELRLLTREAESLKSDRDHLEVALHETRAKVTELEAKLADVQRPRRWWRRRASAAPES
jgi:polyhydroxyalkanoate synthesis regulator phasin